jgi:protein-disulfide isomerase
MNVLTRSLAAALTAACCVSVPSLVQAQSFSQEQRGEIGRIVKDYLLANPEVLQEAIAELEKRQAVAEADRNKESLAKNRDMLINSPRQVVLGNPQGDVTLVEFFDYNCGYCKRAMTDMLELIKTDPKLRVVLKELPILGEESLEAAQVAVAVRMQDKTGSRYLDFHQKLFANRGRLGKTQALAAAKASGADMARIEKDMQSPEIAATLQEGLQLAQSLGINGTPGYVVGDAVVAGAIGVPALRQQVEKVRAGK